MRVNSCCRQVCHIGDPGSEAEKSVPDVDRAVKALCICRLSESVGYRFPGKQRERSRRSASEAAVLHPCASKRPNLCEYVEVTPIKKEPRKMVAADPQGADLGLPDVLATNDM